MNTGSIPAAAAAGSARSSIAPVVNRKRAFGVAQLQRDLALGVEPLTVVLVPPARATPKYAIGYSGTLGAKMPTTCPGSKPQPLKTGAPSAG